MCVCVPCQQMIQRHFHDPLHAHSVNIAHGEALDAQALQNNTERKGEKQKRVMTDYTLQNNLCGVWARFAQGHAIKEELNTFNTCTLYKGSHSFHNTYANASNH